MSETKKTVEKGDFVEVEFKGMTKEGRVFDTTDAEVAKKNDFFNPNAEYKPKVICVGEGHILMGIDEQIIGKGFGKKYTIELSPEKAFGKKTAKLLKLVPMSVFRKQRIDPVPGLQIMIENSLATIRTVTGGRVIVDFNHPMAGQDIIYEIKINRVLTESKEKLDAAAQLYFGDAETEVKEDKAIIKLKQNLPKELTTHLSEELKRLIPELKEIEITGEKV